ncbi:MAG: glycerol-3-phosphate 1-O-acyltransferase PlsY [Planctomycetes bacterium]|nr:glycerol-3-phosphate 1-O-acyltransferase PlsY [Planctomycetota bacterium]MDA0948663.1 glycerol-3-phosphate 1-O-acyltransferase PlsY [Planctomycetota bacterium]
MALALLLAYLLGSVPFGLVLSRTLAGVDPRTVGSGNIGATNTIRAAGKPIGLLAFVLDVGKGMVPALVLADDPELAACAMAAAVLGHCFSLYLGFKGGKGVATMVGGVLALDPQLLLVGGLVWVGTLALTRWVSLASILMTAGFAVGAAARFGISDLRAVALGVLAVLVLGLHRANLGRILAGTEPRAFSGGRGKVEDAAKTEETDVV